MNLFRIESARPGGKFHDFGIDHIVVPGLDRQAVRPFRERRRQIFHDDLAVVKDIQHTVAQIDHQRLILFPGQRNLLKDPATRIGIGKPAHQPSPAGEAAAVAERDIAHYEVETLREPDFHFQIEVFPV